MSEQPKLKLTPDKLHGSKLYEDDPASDLIYISMQSENCSLHGYASPEEFKIICEQLGVNPNDRSDS